MLGIKRKVSQDSADAADEDAALETHLEPMPLTPHAFDVAAKVVGFGPGNGNV